MATELEMLEAIRRASAEQPAGGKVWIDTHQKLDLCKLKVSDLTQAKFDMKVAEGIVAALNMHDVAPLGAALGIELGVRFKVWAERQDGMCRIRCEGAGNATWLQQYLAKRCLDFQATDPIPIEDRKIVAFDVKFTSTCTAYLIRRSLTDCPAVLLMHLFAVSVTEQPHYTVQAYNLADWLDNQIDPDDIWWTVDGDPILMSQLEFPAPPDELAQKLRQIDKPLLVNDPNGTGNGEELIPEEINKLSESDEWGHRRFLMCWKGSQTDWELIEDEPTSECLNRS